MRLQDLIELFVDDADTEPRSADELVGSERRDTSSLAEIVRILRELDGQHATEQDP
jgi:hypothetical protein